MHTWVHTIAARARVCMPYRRGKNGVTIATRARSGVSHCHTIKSRSPAGAVFNVMTFNV